MKEKENVNAKGFPFLYLQREARQKRLGNHCTNFNVLKSSMNKQKLRALHAPVPNKQTGFGLSHLVVGGPGLRSAFPLRHREE